MQVGVIGSRGLNIDNLEDYLPRNTTAIVSGGAIGIDSSAARFARRLGIKLIVFRPDYEHFGCSAPLRRNIEIIENSDIVLAFWDRKSRGTAFVISKCEEKNVPVKIFVPNEDGLFIPLEK